MTAVTNIIYQDEDIVAVHKPAGLKMHRYVHDAPREGVLLKEVRSLTGHWIYPVHRLDRAASGVVLFGTSSKMARGLAEQFKDRRVVKTYLAVVRGYVEPEGCIDSALSADAYAPKCGQTLRPALTCFRRLAMVELDFPVGPYATCRYSLVTVYPRTGRTHQIRRHFHHIRHPLIGDTSYGDLRHNRFFREHFECRRLLLAATELQLVHPRTGEPLHLTAPLEESFQQTLRKIGWLEYVPEAWRTSNGPRHAD